MANEDGVIILLLYEYPIFTLCLRFVIWLLENLMCYFLYLHGLICELSYHGQQYQMLWRGQEINCWDVAKTPYIEWKLNLGLSWTLPFTWIAVNGSVIFYENYEFDYFIELNSPLIFHRTKCWYERVDWYLKDIIVNKEPSVHN